eukprot:TRINITY_DN24984_c0_g1_i1.p1 TRINITY_DN24984_c0_g1~~TRINITY_DN24984_c0_g1_i1.p1  ORF type:complete len:636 (+),score=192.23 TRINITY_DN24984_c0_g1_i1:105-2012(+)
MTAPEGGASDDDAARCWLHRRVRRRLRRAGDSDRDVAQKVVMFFVCAAVGGPINLLAGAAVALHPGVAFCLLWELAAVIMWCHRRMSWPFLGFVTAVGSAATVVWDLYGLASLRRYWPVFVLQIDALLVFDGPRWMTQALVVFVIAYLAISEIELNTRAFGLLDLPGSMPPEERRAVMNCEAPPCPRDDPEAIPSALALPVLVFVVDFILTRGFADRARRETEKLDAAVKAAEHIAASLAGFDLDEAASYLTSSDVDLPEKLRTSLSRLVGNLASYRPYLPQSCLPVADESFSDAHGADDVSVGEGAATLWSESGLPSDGSASSTSSSDGLSCTSSTSVCFSHVSRASSQRFEALRSNHLVRREVTVVHLQFHHLPDARDLADFDAYIGEGERLLAAVMGAVGAHRGLIHGFVGGTVSAAFGAGLGSRVYYDSAVKALGMLTTLHAEGLAGDFQGAVITAPAVIGVLGTAKLRRPILLGEGPQMAAHLAAYVALARKEAYVCNTAQYKKTRTLHDMRVIMDRVLLNDVEGDAEAADGCALAVLYELMLDHPHGSGTEWMYELARNASGKWGEYNTAGRQYLLGRGQGEISNELWESVCRAAALGVEWLAGPRARPLRETKVELTDLSSWGTPGYP